MSLSRHQFLAPLVAIICVCLLVGGSFYLTSKGEYEKEALLMFTFLYGVTNAAILAFSFLLFPKAEPSQFKARLKTQLTAIKSGFAVTLAFIASIPLFSMEDKQSNAIMSDTFLLSIMACAILAVPFFYSTHLLNLLEEE